MRCDAMRCGEPENACSCHVPIQPAAPTHSNGDVSGVGIGEEIKRGENGADLSLESSSLHSPFY